KRDVLPADVGQLRDASRTGVMEPGRSKPTFGANAFKVEGKQSRDVGGITLAKKCSEMAAEKQPRQGPDALLIGGCDDQGALGTQEPVELPENKAGVFEM